MMDARRCTPRCSFVVISFHNVVSIARMASSTCEP
jgi:hypothetical protein